MSELPWFRVAGAHCGWAGAPLPFVMCPFQVGIRDTEDGVREPLGDAQEVNSQVSSLVLVILKSFNLCEP